MNGLFQKRFNSLQFPKGIVEILAGGESSTEPAVGGGGEGGEEDHNRSSVWNYNVWLSKSKYFVRF